MFCIGMNCFWVCCCMCYWESEFASSVCPDDSCLTSGEWLSVKIFIHWIALLLLLASILGIIVYLVDSTIYLSSSSSGRIKKKKDLRKGM